MWRRRRSREDDDNVVPVNVVRDRREIPAGLTDAVATATTQGSGSQHTHRDEVPPRWGLVAAAKEERLPHNAVNAT
jgi:hypothetical protein